MYLTAVLRNLLIILAIIYVYHVHTPMYFFITNLSSVDTCFDTTNPEWLVNIRMWVSGSLGSMGHLICICLVLKSTELENGVLVAMS